MYNPEDHQINIVAQGNRKYNVCHGKQAIHTCLIRCIFYYMALAYLIKWIPYIALKQLEMMGFVHFGLDESRLMYLYLQAQHVVSTPSRVHAWVFIGVGEVVGVNEVVVLLRCHPPLLP